MREPTRFERLPVSFAGAVLALFIAVALFTRFGIDDTLSRDESIYAYGGQQLTHGVPFYASVFDPKTPLSPMLAAVGAAAADVVGAYDLYGIRAVFFVFACLTIVAVYLLALWSFESPLAGLVAAATFTSFKAFATDALGGPDAKTPGVFFAVLSLALLARRQWFWGAFAGSLAFLVWQPLAIYAAVAVLGAWVTCTPEARRRCALRALAGAAIPAVAMTLFYWIAGALPKLVEAAFLFPATGLRHTPETEVERILRIVRTVHDGLPRTYVLFWAGLILLLGLVVARFAGARWEPHGAIKDVLISSVMATFLAIGAFSLSDFQSPPDLYPLLPYAALGLGGAVALGKRRLAPDRARLAVTSVTVAAVTILVALSWTWYANDPRRGPSLPAQRLTARTIERVIGPTGTLMSLGNPAPLVLTGRRSPSPFIYLSSGVDAWMLHHEPGGLAGWQARISAANPALVVLTGWRSPITVRMLRWLKSRYDARVLGRWLVFIRPDVRARATARGLL